MAHALQFALFQQCASDGEEHGFICGDHVLRKPHDDLAKPVDTTSVDQLAPMGAFQNLRGVGLITAVEQHGHCRKCPPILFESRGDLHHGAAGLQCGETFSRCHGQKPYQCAVLLRVRGQEGRQEFDPIRTGFCRGFFEPERKRNRLGGGKMRQIVFPQIVGA
ncbi:hypothetical protein D3C87_1353150 [compost metagenome]